MRLLVPPACASSTWHAPSWRWDGVVVGEPARAFYGNQFSLTFPVIDHHGVELWVPEVGGRVDPGSEALFGGMSKGERTRVKIRVKAAMADMAEREGRFLGGRPPCGYRLSDAGPHPNPEKAAAGIRLHRLEPDPTTRVVVSRIFAMYLGGAGFRTIAQKLTDEDVASPSGYDPARNTRRSGQGWAFVTVRTILANPRYTGRQVWGRQPRHESLLNPDSPQDGYVTHQRWAKPDAWLRSDRPVHEPLVDDLRFKRAEALMRSKGADVQRRARSPKASSPYVLAGRVTCAMCGRKMSGHRSGTRLGYQCQLRATYALPATDPHPTSVWVTENALTAVTFDWLGEVSAADNRDQVLERIAAASDEPHPDLAIVGQDLKEAQRRIGRLVDAVENGTFSPEEVVDKLHRLREQRDSAKAVLAAAEGMSGRLDPRAIAHLLDELGGLVVIGGELTRQEAAALFAAADISIRYEPTARLATFTVDLAHGVSVRVGGGTSTLTPRLELTGERTIPAA